MRLDDALLLTVKRYAAQHGRTVTSVLEEALRRLLSEAERAGQRQPVALPVSSVGGGLQPGVDLDDGAALADLMQA